MPRNRSILPIFFHLLDYGPIILTTVLATVASLRAIKSDISAGEIQQWILVVLGLLATTQLVDRFRIIREIETKINTIASGAQGQVGVGAVYKSHIPDLRDRVRGAKSVAISGISLSRTSADMWAVFRERLEVGGDVRLLLVDPEHSALQFAAARFQKHQDPDRLKREIQHALDNLEPLSKITRGSFSLRFMPMSPPYGIWVIDPGQPHAEIWVELYSFRDLPEPAFQLLPERDSEWFSFFQRQFELMWVSGREWKINKEMEV